MQVLPSNFSVNFIPAWQMFRGVMLWFWGICTTRFLTYGTLSFSIFDVFFGFVVVAIILRLVYSRMHLATAVGNLRDMNSRYTAQRYARHKREERERNKSK